jgi:hypothetical protein
MRRPAPLRLGLGLSEVIVASLLRAPCYDNRDRM